jgi:hypothetical protein
MLYPEMMLPSRTPQRYNPHAHHLHDLAAEARAARRAHQAVRLRRRTAPPRARGLRWADSPADAPEPGT